MTKDIAELFKIFSKLIGFSDSQTNYVIFWILLIGIIYSLLSKSWKLFKRLILAINRRKLNKDLFPYFSVDDVFKATKFYIPTKYQNVAPSEDEEPGRKYIASAKNRLIPLFLKKVFPLGKHSNKYYLILADSGMGKTTFLINLYLAYKNQWESPFSSQSYDIKLIPIWHNNFQSAINGVAQKENTILLLDALPKLSTVLNG